MAKHFINAPMSNALLGDPSLVLSCAIGQTSKAKFDGAPYTTLACLAPNLDGERVLVDIPGTVPGLTEDMVRTGLHRLAFVRVKFSNLVLEIKGGEYNAVSYRGTAERAALVQPETPQK